MKHLSTIHISKIFFFLLNIHVYFPTIWILNYSTLYYSTVHDKYLWAVYKQYLFVSTDCIQLLDCLYVRTVNQSSKPLINAQKMGFVPIKCFNKLSANSSWTVPVCEMFMNCMWTVNEWYLSVNSSGMVSVRTVHEQCLCEKFVNGVCEQCL